MDEAVSINAYVNEYIKKLPLLISKSIDTRRTGTAFYVPEFNVRKAGRITDGKSVYTAEMTAMLMALEWAHDVGLDKV